MAAKYYVYRNLHKGGFSVKYRGKVILRPERFYLINPELKISKASQSRARDKGQRNVHAYVVADEVGITRDGTVLPWPKGRLYYNPFKHDTFVNAVTKKPVVNPSYVWFDGNTAYYA